MVAIAQALMSEIAFSDLLERARQGDDEAMEQLIQEYEPQVRLVARHRLSRPLRAILDTMDLVQSVHYALLRGLRENKFTLASPQDLIALAVTMVNHKAARKWQRLQREQHILKLHRLLLARAGSDPCPELTELVQSLLATVSDRDRRLLLLYLQGHSTQQVAQILGVDANSLRVRRSRLFRKLRASGLDID
jgi:RNA polymerase sigma-70 factor (ECF subfamily)